MKLTKEQSRAIRSVLKAKYRDGYKLAYLESFVWHMGGEENTSVWVCDMAHIMGKGIYIITSFQENMNMGGIEQKEMAFGRNVIKGLLDKEKPFLEAREKRRKGIFA